MSHLETEAELTDLIDEFSAIRTDMVGIVEESADLLNEVHPQHQPSARNLLHYLALRSRDLRPLQTRLSALGLSSLGRAESQVLPAVDAVLSVLTALNGPHNGALRPLEVVDVTAGQRLLAEHTEALFGPPTDGRDVRIMVTMPRKRRTSTCSCTIYSSRA